MKIASKIGLSFFVINVSCTAAALFVFYFIARNDLQQLTETKLESVVHSRTDHITTYLKMLEASVEQLSKSMVLDNLLRTAITNNLRPTGTFETAMARLQETKKSNPSIHELFLLDKTGRIIASTIEKNIGNDKSTDAYFLGAQQGIYIKDAYDSTTTHEPLLAIAGPLTDRQAGKLLGVIVAKVKLHDLRDIVANKIGLGETGEIYIVNKYRFMITPSRF